MKQTLFQNMLKAAGAFLFAVTMSAGFTACTDTIDNPATPVDPDPENEREFVDPTPEPTEDAVAYTIDCSYAVFGNIDDEIGKAISRRLKGTPDVPSMAQLYFLDPQRGVDLGMGEEKWQELVGRTRSGEAALILSQCTFSDFYTFTKYYIQGMVELSPSTISRAWWSLLPSNTPATIPTRSPTCRICRPRPSSAWPTPSERDGSSGANVSPTPSR